MANDKGLMLEYYVPITESAEVDGDFTIHGIAINETTTSNGHKFISEELSKSASTLVGVPLLVDHDNSVHSIVGRVKGAYFDEALKSIPFKAIVKNQKMKEMIKDGLIDSVSVGAHVNPADIEETTDGDIIPHNIIFQELSLVAVPAAPLATFNVALNNAWSGHKSHSTQVDETHTDERGSDNVVEMAEEEQPKVETEEVTKPEEPKEEKSEEKEEKEDVSEKVLSMLTSMDKRLKKMEEADADEVPKEEVKEEVAEVKPEKDAEEEETEEEETEEVQEKGDYKLVESRNAFTVVRKDYSKRLTA